MRHTCDRSAWAGAGQCWRKTVDAFRTRMCWAVHGAQATSTRRAQLSSSEQPRACLQAFANKVVWHPVTHQTVDRAGSPTTRPTQPLPMKRVGQSADTMCFWFPLRRGGPWVLAAACVLQHAGRARGRLGRLEGPGAGQTVPLHPAPEPLDMIPVLQPCSIETFKNLPWMI
jgi:hypothetical protein